MANAGDGNRDVKSVSGRDLAAARGRHSWKLLRVNGSHHIFGKQAASSASLYLIRRNHQLKIGLLKHLLKIAGLTGLNLV
jgi:predicted RNA binding protein YcfA (HicA-like mRNA interferase family)